MGPILKKGMGLIGQIYQRSCWQKFGLNEIKGEMYWLDLFEIANRNAAAWCTLRIIGSRFMTHVFAAIVESSLSSHLQAIRASLVPFSCFLF